MPSPPSALPLPRQESSGLSSVQRSVLIGITVIQVVLGVAAIFGSVFLVDSFTNGIKNATVFAKNLPVDSNVLINGVMPIAVVVPQSIIIPAIFGIVAVVVGAKCSYLTHCVFSLVGTLWSPVQTTAVLFYVVCYGFIYAQHLDDYVRNPREELQTLFFCLVGIFLGSLIMCFVSLASTITSCCIFCRCCRNKQQAPRRWVLLSDSDDSTALLQHEIHDSSHELQLQQQQQQQQQQQEQPPPYNVIILRQPMSPGGERYSAWLCEAPPATQGSSHVVVPSTSGAAAADFPQAGRQQQQQQEAPLISLE